MEAINWLSVALGRLGTDEAAAEALNVELSTILLWRTDGIRHAQFRYVVALSRLANVGLVELSASFRPAER